MTSVDRDVLVLTLYSGENEYERCRAAVRDQRSVRCEHVVFEHLPNKEAHDLLAGAAETAGIEFVGFVEGGDIPSDRVDVIVTLDQGDFQDNPVSRIVLQGVPVLAAGQEIQESADGQPQTVTVITLMVSPEEAEVLILSATEGQIQLALRNTLDLDSLETAGIRVEGLVPTQQQARAAPRRTSPRPPPQPRTSAIEVYRGPELTEENVEEGGGSQ